MIMDFEVTKLGERGQIVIPLEIRKKLKLKKGDKFIVSTSGKLIVFSSLKLEKQKKKLFIKRRLF